MSVCLYVFVCVWSQFRTGLILWVGVEIPDGKLLVSELNWHDMAQATCQVVCVFMCVILCAPVCTVHRQGMLCLHM